MNDTMGSDSLPVGPGQYNIPSGLKKSLPGFTAFSSSARRGGEPVEGNRIVEVTPGPGEHDVGKVLGAHWSKKSGSGSAFKSNTSRFSEAVAQAPGPTTYTIPSSIKVEKPKRYRKTKLDVDIKTLNPSVVPSIPTRFQSYGYEAGNDGKLALQDPVVPGYSGTKTDGVGPGDYDPKIDVKYTSKSISFGHTDRNFNVSIVRDRLTNPGPGYYNHQSSFEDFDNIAGNQAPSAKTDYYVKLNNSMKRHALSSFESKTKREFINETLAASLPGPGKYSVPTEIKAAHADKTPQHLQCFATSDVRFKDPVPRSMRLATAPGSYNPLTSSFEMNKLQILKKKKMSSRSGWVQNIAFAGTEKRFMDVADDLKESGPTPGTYNPKVSLIDEMNRHTNKFNNTKVHGGFGVKDKRFEENKVINQMGAIVAPRAQHEYGGQPQGLGGDINIGFEGVPTVANGGGGASSSSLRKPNRPKLPTSVFVNQEHRFCPVKDTPGPAPGSYDTFQKWDKAKGIVPMVNKRTPSLKQAEEDATPGPGDYNVALSYVKKVKNRKNILVSTTDRFSEPRNAREQAPTATSYDPWGPLTGTLEKKSHNVLLSTQ
jgi:hypothetical protein